LERTEVPDVQQADSKFERSKSRVNESPRLKLRRLSAHASISHHAVEIHLALGGRIVCDDAGLHLREGDGRAEIVRCTAAIQLSEDTLVRPAQGLDELRNAEANCTRCPLYQHATQVVPGEGPRDARVMFVGEQPGNEEDLSGRPFVGPAGRILDRAIADAGLDRVRIFVTNAVKHFKFEERGKRRLHKRPNAYEIDRCRWWLDQERALIRPDLVVALGVTAARGILGRTVTLAKVRGQIFSQTDGGSALVTIHPSYLLRIERDADEAEKAAAYRRFVEDLTVCAKALHAAANE
jgi:uracil-DNA glycosylase